MRARRIRLELRRVGRGMLSFIVRRIASLRHVQRRLRIGVSLIAWLIVPGIASTLIWIVISLSGCGRRITLRSAIARSGRYRRVGLRVVADGLVVSMLRVGRVR